MIRPLRTTLRLVGGAAVPCLVAIAVVVALLSPRCQQPATEGPVEPHKFKLIWRDGKAVAVPNPACKGEACEFCRKYREGRRSHHPEPPDED